MFQLFKPTPEHVAMLAKLVNHPDLDWYTEQLKKTSEQLVQMAIDSSEHSWAMFEGDKLLAIFGLRPDQSSMLVSRAEVWVYSSKFASDYPVRFLRAARAWSDQMLAMYSELFAYVDERFTQSVQMCRFAGFEIRETIYVGPRRCYLLEKNNV